MSDDQLDLLQRVAVLFDMFDEAVDGREIVLHAELAETLLEVAFTVDLAVEAEVNRRDQSNPESEL